MGRTCSQSTLCFLWYYPVQCGKLTRPQQGACGQAKVQRPTAPDVSGHSACVRSPAVPPRGWGERLAGTGNPKREPWAKAPLTPGERKGALASDSPEKLELSLATPGTTSGSHTATRFGNIKVRVAFLATVEWGA